MQGMTVARKLLCLMAPVLLAPKPGGALEVHAPGADHEIVELSANPSNPEEAVVISRKYLGGQWSEDSRPDWGDKEEFRIKTVDQGDGAHLLSRNTGNIEPGRHDIIGSGIWQGSSYHFPVTYKDTDGETVSSRFRHDAAKNELESLNRARGKPLSSLISTHALSDGHLEVHAHRATQEIFYFPLGNETGNAKLTPYQSVKSPDALQDVAVSSTRPASAAFLFRGTTESGNTYLRIAEYTDVVSGEMKEDVYISPDRKTYSAELIHPGGPRHQVATTSLFDFFIWGLDPEVNILDSLNGGAVIDQHNLEKIEAFADIGIAGLCEGSYLLALPGDKTTLGESSDGRGSVKLLLMSSSGTKELETFLNQSATTILRGIHLTSSGDKAYIGVNFSRFEEERREDGWYSWHGFRVQQYDLPASAFTDCET